MKQAMEDRDKRLNSRVPGVDHGTTSGGERYDGQAELLKARAEAHKNPTEKNRKKYIDMAAEIGAVRYPNARR